MKAVTTSGRGTHDVSTLSSGLGVAVAILLGIAIALFLRPVINDIVVLLHDALIALGMTAGSATVALYWIGMAAIGAGFLVALNGPEVTVNRLRAEFGEWAAVLLQALTAACATVLWLAAAATWANFEDEFNTYGPGTELPAVALAVLMIAGAVALRLMRRRRTRA